MHKQAITVNRYANRGEKDALGAWWQCLPLLESQRRLWEKEATDTSLGSTKKEGNYVLARKASQLPGQVTSVVAQGSCLL